MAKKLGCPTKYKEEFCDKLIEHMKQGYSFESFAAIVDVDRDTLYEWAKVHPIFSDAKKRAQMQGLLYDEQLLCMLTKGALGKFANATPHIFKMKCKHRHVGWNDIEPVTEEKVQVIIK